MYMLLTVELLNKEHIGASFVEMTMLLILSCTVYYVTNINMYIMLPITIPVQCTYTIVYIYDHTRLKQINLPRRHDVFKILKKCRLND